MKATMLTMKTPRLRSSRETRRAEATPDSLKIKNVLVPLDFSKPSHAALRFALPLLDQFGANLHLAHILLPDSPISGLADIPIIIPNVETGSRVRRQMAAVARDHGAKLRPDALHVGRGSPFAEICQVA